MPGRGPFLVLAVLIAPAAAMALGLASTTASTTELKSDSLAPPPSATVELDAVPDKSSAILASSLLGQPIYVRDGKQIGQISGIVMTQELDDLLAIVGIVGFLGFGARDVAVPVDRIAVTENTSGELRFTASLTKEQLQRAAVFDRTALMR